MTLLAGFLSMLILDVLHQSVSTEGMHSNDREPSTEYQAANGDAEFQQNGHRRSSPSGVASSNFMTTIIVRALVWFCDLFKISLACVQPTGC